VCYFNSALAVGFSLFLSLGRNTTSLCLCDQTKRIEKNSSIAIKKIDITSFIVLRIR